MEDETPKAKRPDPHINEVVRKAIVEGLRQRGSVQHLLLGLAFMVSVLLSLVGVVQHMQIQIMNERLGEIGRDMKSLKNQCESNPTIGDPYDSFEDRFDDLDRQTEILRAKTLRVLDLITDEPNQRNQ